MSCGSGKAVADLIDGRKPDISLLGLGIDRF
jgi:D-amino-acid dehydrogenase